MTSCPSKLHTPHTHTHTYRERDREREKKWDYVITACVRACVCAFVGVRFGVGEFWGRVHVQLMWRKRHVAVGALKPHPFEGVCTSWTQESLQQPGIVRTWVRIPANVRVHGDAGLNSFYVSRFLGRVHLRHDWFVPCPGTFGHHPHSSGGQPSHCFCSLFSYTLVHTVCTYLVCG